MTSPAIVEELCLLLNDIHVRLEMLKGVAATESNPEFDWLLEQVKMQEVVILAKLAALALAFERTVAAALNAPGTKIKLEGNTEKDSAVGTNPPGKLSDRWL